MGAVGIQRGGRGGHRDRDPTQFVCVCVCACAGVGWGREWHQESIGRKPEQRIRLPLPRYVSFSNGRKGWWWFGSFYTSRFYKHTTAPKQGYTIHLAD